MNSFGSFLARGILIAGILQWSITAVQLIRAQRGTLAARLAVGLSITIVGYLSVLLILVFPAPDWIQHLLYVLMFASPWFLWVFACSIFRDGFRLNLKFFAVGIVANCFGLLTYYPQTVFSRPFIEWLRSGPEWEKLSTLLIAGGPQFFTYVFAFAALREALSGRRVDLIETRLKFRRGFVFFLSLTAGVIATGDVLIKMTGQYYSEITFFEGLLVFIAGYSLNLHLSRSGPGSAVSLVVSAGETPTSFDLEIQRDLEILLNEEKVYLDPELDVEKLAKHLKIPTYRLRRFINKVLGFQNFNQFLNYHRIMEAKRRLKAPEGRDLPIYNLAMELGYGSLISFNRAFKEATSTTPSQFRNRTDSENEK